MKVLIETISNRRGYKYFNSETELDNFLADNYQKIVEYQIMPDDEKQLLQEDGLLNDKLKDLLNKCNILSKKAMYIFFYDAHKSKQYEKLYFVSGRLYECAVALNKMINQQY